MLGTAGYMVGGLLDYTVISWDWGYLSIPIPSPSRLTISPIPHSNSTPEVTLNVELEDLNNCDKM